MSFSDWVTLATVVIGLPGAAVASITLYRTCRQRKADKRQENLEQEQAKLTEITTELNRHYLQDAKRAEEERKKADLRAEIIEVGRNKWRLRVYNQGQTAARNVRLDDLQKPNSVLVQSDIERKFGKATIEPDGEINVIALMTFDGPRHAHIKLIWDDDAGNHEKEIEAPFP